MSHRPLLAEPLDIDAIIAEQAAHEARVVAEAETIERISEQVPFFAAVKAVRDANRCVNCGKTLALLNARQFRQRGFHMPYIVERPDPEIHCTCVGGPAYIAPPTDASDVVLAPSVTVETISRLFYAANGGGWIEPGVRGVVVKIETHRKIATLLFEGHDKPYLMNVRDLRARVKAVAA